MSQLVKNECKKSRETVPLSEKEWKVFKGTVARDYLVSFWGCMNRSGMEKVPLVVFIFFCCFIFSL